MTNINKAVKLSIQKQSQALKAYVFTAWDGNDLDGDVIQEGIIKRLLEAGMPLEGTTVNSDSGAHTLVLSGELTIKYHEDMPFCERYKAAIAGIFTHKECDTLFTFFTRVYKPE